MEEETEQELHSYNTLLILWQSENPIKTIKLQFLLASNAGLFGFLSLAENNIALLSVSAVVLNVIWMLSIGRTSLFQRAWKNKLDEVASRHPGDARFQILAIKSAAASAPAWLRFVGGVSSKYYLLGAPAGLALTWLVITLRLV